MSKLYTSILFTLLSIFSFAQNEPYRGGSGGGDKTVTQTRLYLFKPVWTGNGSTSWNDPANWQNGQVPDAGQISIDASAAQDLVLDQSRTVNAVQFSGSGRKLIVGNHTLTLTGSVTGADANNFIQVAGTAMVKRSITHSEAFTFPIGNSTYNPVSITNKTGTADDFSVRIDDAVYANGLSGTEVTRDRVNRTWQISKTSPTANAGNGVDFTFQWNTAHESGTIATYQLNHHNGTTWNLAAGVGTTESVSGTNPKVLTFTGYKGTFSPFSIGSAGGSLPVTWLDFSARQEDRQVQLQWKTASEQNTKSFLIERSADGMRYITIGETAAAGNSQTVRTYAFIDPKPLQGRTFYRLRQLDLDGQFSFSKVVDITPNVGAAVLIGPSPTDGPLTLYVPASWQGSYEGSLRNLQGREVLRTTALRSGVTRLSVQALPPGMYLLRLEENGQILQQQWILKK
jgi:hypothetical protein